MSGDPNPLHVTSTGADQPYWDAMLDGKLVMPRCRGCGRWHWPAVWRCGECGSWDHDWNAVEPVGTIYTWSRTWHRFPGIESLGSPFISLVVEIEGTEGRRLTGLLEGPDAGVAIGSRVRGRVAEVEAAGQRLPAFRWRLDDGASR